MTTILLGNLSISSFYVEMKILRGNFLIPLLFCIEWELSELGMLSSRGIVYLKLEREEK